MKRSKRMQLFLQIIFVLTIIVLSAAYLNWVAFVKAGGQDGTLGSVLNLAMKWYGLPLVVIVQLAIWWSVPTLYKLTPSPYIAALAWPLVSSVTIIVLFWKKFPPTKGDYIAVAANLLLVVIAWWAKKYWG